MGWSNTEWLEKMGARPWGCDARPPPNAPVARLIAYPDRVLYRLPAATVHECISSPVYPLTQSLHYLSSTSVTCSKFHTNFSPVDSSRPRRHQFNHSSRIARLEVDNTPRVPHEPIHIRTGTSFRSQKRTHYATKTCRLVQTQGRDTLRGWAGTPLGVGCGFLTGGARREEAQNDHAEGQDDDRKEQGHGSYRGKRLCKGEGERVAITERSERRTRAANEQGAADPHQLPQKGRGYCASRGVEYLRTCRCAEEGQYQRLFV